MNFVTFDFETATEKRNSPCEIGLTFVENNEIKETKSYLIKPPQFPHFNSFNISIHGITPELVKKAKEFDDHWTELKDIFENNLMIAHNAGFDVSVLRKTLDHYLIEYPQVDYGCTYVFSKKAFPDSMGFGLAELCRKFNIPLEHHRGGSDSLATAHLAIRIFKEHGITAPLEIADTLEVTLGELFPNGYKPCGNYRKPTSSDRALPKGNSELNQIDNFFYGKNIVFTGKLESMTRNDAQQLIADIGGINQKSVTKTTNVLVMGEFDYRFWGDDELTNKQKKAYDLRKSGADIEILKESQFLELL